MYVMIIVQVPSCVCLEKINEKTTGRYIICQEKAECNKTFLKSKHGFSGSSPPTSTKPNMPSPVFISEG